MSDFAEMLKDQLTQMSLAQQMAYQQGYQAGYMQGARDATTQANKLLDDAVAQSRKLPS